MIVLKNVFMPQNRNILYAQNCSNNIYWKLNNYINSAITSKWLYTWWTNIFPEYYTIQFQPKKNKINFWYKNQWISTIHETLALSWSFAKTIDCQSNNYQVVITGSIQEIQINKWLQSKDNNPIFQLHTNWIQNFTGNIELKICDLEHINCKIFAKYIIDTRTKHINYAKCTVFTGNNNTECEKRNQ